MNIENQVAAKAELEATNVETNQEEVEAKESAQEVNQRLLNESKKYKEQFKQTKAELDAIKKKQLEEQGNYKQMAENYQKQLEEFQEAFLTEKVNTALSRAAEKYGCVSVDALNKLGNHDLLQFDEETMQISGVEEMIEDARKNHPYLFKSQQIPSINQTRPSGGVMEPKQYSASDIAKIKDPKVKAELWKQAMLNTRLK